MYLVYVEQAVHGSLSVHLEIGTFYLFFSENLYSSLMIWCIDYFACIPVPKKLITDILGYSDLNNICSML